MTHVWSGCYKSEDPLIFACVWVTGSGVDACWRQNLERMDSICRPDLTELYLEYRLSTVYDGPVFSSVERSGEIMGTTNSSAP